MPAWPLALSQAQESDLPAITSLIKEAAAWLRSKPTDQWARPWPSEAALHDRVETALRRGISWICWDSGKAAATITVDPEHDPYWSGAELAETAVYVHRLVVGRRYAGYGLGAELLDWAGHTARRDHGARWIRVSVWTNNDDLHAYYRRQNFSLIGFHPDPGYPSRARFQKPTHVIANARPTLFRLV